MPTAAAPSMAADRAHAQALDATDPLAPLRELFALPEGRIYLDGNSLGALPRATAGRLAQVVEQQWGQGLIGSWNDAGWMALPQRIGDKIARLVGVGTGEVVVADSTSVNLFKVLSAALAMQRQDAPRRAVIVSERSNFPTDLYIARALADQHGATLRLVDSPAQIAAALDERCAVLLLTQVNYRTGWLHDMAALSAAAHAAGALAVWDLAHSAGALPVALAADGADFAVGCGYKYLNGGPGAPAFVWVRPDHVDRFAQPLSGWLGHAAPFDFDAAYRPAAGIARYLCGTPPLLAMAALDCGVDTLLAAEPLGGMAALRAKSLALTGLMAARVASRCAGHGLAIVSPSDDSRRGSQLSLARGDGAHAIVQALIARGVVGDFRAGRAPSDRAAGAIVDVAAAADHDADILRFGVTPLYTRFVDVWDAVEQLREVLECGQWREARFSRRAAVT